MIKGSDGLWTGTSTAGFLPGAWRYHFRVDGMDVPDPRNVLSSPFQYGTESLLVVPGDISQTRSVPHGAVAGIYSNCSGGAGDRPILRDNAIACIARFKQAGVHLETEETADGHEWKNWRLYLSQVVPILFR